MPKLVLVGNSVNRLGSGPSWSGVVTTLAKAAGLGASFDVSGKPLPIVYEHVVCRKGCDETALKKELADSMKELDWNGAHRRALALAAPNLLTTNYDYCFEQSHSASRQRAHLGRETTYSAYRRVRVGNRFVWHIHGELDAPRCLLLGFHHYAGYLQKLRAYVTSRPKRSPFLKGDLAFEESGEPFSWVDLFLRDDVHIVGLTLDYIEIHLWWLIAYKLRLRAKELNCGATHFYHFRVRDEGPEVATRLLMFKDLGVVIHEINVDESWERAHDDAFDLVERA